MKDKPKKNESNDSEPKKNEFGFIIGSTLSQDDERKLRALRHKKLIDSKKESAT